MSDAAIFLLMFLCCVALIVRGVYLYERGDR